MSYFYMLIWTDASSESQCKAHKLILEISPYNQLSLHLNWAMPTSLLALIVTYNHLLTSCYHKTSISYLCRIENAPKYAPGKFSTTLKVAATHCQGSK